MSKPSRPSPARSQGHTITPRGARTRRTLSMASPARSDTSQRLSSVVDKFINNDKFTLSPMKRKSVLPDDTEIEAPRRASWWKRLEGSSRDVLEALDANKMADELLVEEYEFEVEKENEKQIVSESSDNESVASIVIPHRRLFNQKKPTQGKFGPILGSRKSLGRTNIEDESIDDAPKNLFNKGPRNRPVFPAALLNSTNKTINKTVEPETNKPSRPNLFGQAGTKRKNMFTDFVLSESEEDSEVQQKSQVFGFKKYDNKRISLGTRNRRMPSLTPSMTTEIDIDDWNLLPSSTMIDNFIAAPEVSGIISDKDIEQAENDKDNTLTKGNPPSNRETYKTQPKIIQSDEHNLIEEKMAELHGESKRKEKSQSNLLSNTQEEKIEPIAAKQEDQNNFQEASNTNGDEDMNDVSIKDKGEQDIEPSFREQEQVTRSSSKEANNKNRDEKRDDIFDKNESKAEIEPTADEESREYSKEVSNKNLDENGAGISEKNKTKDESEISGEQEESSECSKEVSNTNLCEDEADISERNKSKEDIEPSAKQEESQECSKEVSNTNLCEDETDISDKNKSEEEIEPNAEQKESLNRSKEANKTYQGEGMKDLSENNQIFDNVETMIEHENDIVDETPDNSPRDTTSQNRKKEITQVKSPEAVLQNMTKDNESFRPIGRSTSFRKSKSVIENINIRPSLASMQESTIGNEGSRDSSTEGSGWDSHRTTRKTIRQTLGKDFTPRKSLRAYVMEQSAKRQTDIYIKNAPKFNKSKNKTVSEGFNDKKALKMNKAKSFSEDAANVSAVNKTKDIKNHMIRDRRVSNRNLSSDQLSPSKSPGHGTSAHHVPDPLISKPQVSYHKSIIDINEPEISEQQISHHEESINISEQANNDSGPEISIHASYGQGMSRDAPDHEVPVEEDHATSDLEMNEMRLSAPKVINREISLRDASVRAKSIYHVPSDEEMLDYEVSDNEKSEQEISEVEEMDHVTSNQENLEQYNSAQSSESLQEEEKEDSEPAESENEVESEQFENGVEPEQSENEVESEQENVEEESQQEEDPESDQEESHQQIEAESEQESEIELVYDMSHESANDISQQQSDQESACDTSEPEREMLLDEDENTPEDADDIISGLNSKYQMSTSNRTERVVFDNEMSEQAIDYELSERVSRQITNTDISEQVSDREATPELTKSRVSECSKVHDISIGTKKSMLLMQMQKIAQQNMEMRQKMREKVQNSLKPTRNFNKMSPMPSKFSIRRINKPEPKKPKLSKPVGVPMGALPKDFVEDLMYKPPKRFQPANAPWITKRLYKFLETKLEPKYDYRARVRAEELVQSLHSFARLVRRRDAAPPAAVAELQREMARLRIVRTHFDFYDFFHEFMPREIRVKVNPDVVNKIPMPRNGVFAEILPASVAVE